MKTLLILSLLLIQGCASTNISQLTPCEEKIYAGVGHKAHRDRTYYLYENKLMYKVSNSGVAGRFGVYVECENIRVGYDHMSDLFRGKPISGNHTEYVSDQYYIDLIYTFE